MNTSRPTIISQRDHSKKPMTLITWLKGGGDGGTREKQFLYEFLLVLMRGIKDFYRKGYSGKRRNEHEGS